MGKPPFGVAVDSKAARFERRSNSGETTFPSVNGTPSDVPRHRRGGGGGIQKRLRKTFERLPCSRKPNQTKPRAPDSLSVGRKSREGVDVIQASRDGPVWSLSHACGDFLRWRPSLALVRCNQGHSAVRWMEVLCQSRHIEVAQDTTFSKVNRLKETTIRDGSAAIIRDVRRGVRNAPHDQLRKLEALAGVSASTN